MGPIVGNHQKNRGCQLLALVSASRSGSRRWTPVQSRLRQVARRTGMKFVLQTASLSEPRDGSDNAPAKAGYSWEERQRTRGDLGGDSGSSTNALEVVVAGEKPADDHVMAAAGAIVQLMRARQRQAHLPTIALANRRCRQPLETNQNRMQYRSMKPPNPFAQTGLQNHRRVRTLLVDDSQFMRALLAMLIEEIDFELVGTAADGRQALRSVADLRPDLVLMDVKCRTWTGSKQPDPSRNLVNGLVMRRRS